MKVSCFAKCLIIVILLLLLYVPVVNAYSFSSILVPYSDPANTWVYISSNVPDNAEVKDAYNNWDYLPEVQTYESFYATSWDAYFAYSTIQTGAYADTRSSGTGDGKIVIIRPSWVNLSSSTQRKEVIAHEMGHCWGLGHGAADSLMRQTGFNNDAFPKGDDENGIHALY